MNLNHTYKPLSNFIKRADKKNKNLKVQNPMGINIDKYFMPSVANIIGTDMTNYKLVSPNQFACNLMHVGRDGKIPVAQNKTQNDILVSPAYNVFEVIDTQKLYPDYLMLWFRRQEFDREASFYTDADVRCGLDFNTLLGMTLPVPNIDDQRRIVSEYETVQRRIDNNRQLINKLEETAQTLYKKMFVEGIDKENLPEGWRMGKLTDIATYLNGTACQKYATDSLDFYPVLKIRELSQGFCDNNSDKASKNIDQEYIIHCGEIVFSWSATLFIDFWCDKEAVLNQHLFKVFSMKYPKWFIYLWTQCYIDEWKRLISAKATSMGHIKREDLENAKVLIPDNITLKKMDNIMKPIFDSYILKKQEVLKLNELKSLLLSKIGR